MSIYTSIDRSTQKINRKQAVFFTFKMRSKYPMYLKKYGPLTIFQLYRCGKKSKYLKKTTDLPKVLWQNLWHRRESNLQQVVICTDGNLGHGTGYEQKYGNEKLVIVSSSQWTNINFNWNVVYIKWTVTKTVI